jgi:phosphoribosylformylglycinamidine (FGAM) synthase-like enzyme
VGTLIPGIYTKVCPVFQTSIFSGKDDMSQQMNSTWDSEAVSKCLEDNGAVAVKIESTRLVNCL